MLEDRFLSLKSSISLVTSSVKLNKNSCNSSLCCQFIFLIYFLLTFEDNNFSEKKTSNNLCSAKPCLIFASISFKSPYSEYRKPFIAFSKSETNKVSFESPFG